MDFLVWVYGLRVKIIQYLKFESGLKLRRSKTIKELYGQTKNGR